MEYGTLIFFPITYWWLLAASLATNFLLYLVKSAVFTVFFGNYLIDTFKLGSYMYDGYPVLVWCGGVLCV